jgi:hypothetical protein
MNVILIEKDGTIFEKNIKTLDKLYSVCGYRTDKCFYKLNEWEFDKNIYELYGKKNGKADKENKYKFPQSESENFEDSLDSNKYYGSLCIVKQNGSISLDEWNIFCMSSLTDTKSIDSELESDVDANSDIEIRQEIMYDVKSYIEEELTYEEYEDE